jgi:protein TonB
MHYFSRLLCAHCFFMSFLIFLLFPSLTLAADSLKGIAVYQELGKEQFIGALYSSPKNSHQSSTNAGPDRRMELKILNPDGLTKRQFMRLWIEGVAVNNHPDVLIAQAENMIKFDTMVKGKLDAGDHIIISSVEGNEVNILLNGIALGVINDGRFFSMLLSVWIGNVPLSSEYRDALLDNKGINLVVYEKFNQLMPSVGRKEVAAAWGDADYLEEESKSQDVKYAQSKNDPTKTSVTNGVASDRHTPEKKIPAVVATPIEKPVVAVPQPSFLDPTPMKQPAAETLDDNESDASNTVTLLARQFYFADLMKKIYNNTRYPKRARDLGQAGNLQIRIAIDRQGNLLDAQLATPTRYELLNKAAIDAVERSQPFAQVPQQLKGSRFEFTVPARFALSFN